MVDIHSATAEIRRGKRWKPQVKNIISASATEGGHNLISVSDESLLLQSFVNMFVAGLSSILHLLSELVA